MHYLWANLEKIAKSERMNKFEKVTFGFLVEDQENDFNPDLLIPAPAKLYLILGLGKA